MTTETGTQQVQSQDRAHQAPAEDDQFGRVGQAVERAAHEHFPSAVQPVLEGVQSRMLDVTRRHSLGSFELTVAAPEQTSVRSALSNTWRSVLVFALASGRRQSERALRSVLQEALAAAYSDAVRSRIQRESKERTQKLARETLQTLPQDARSKGVQRRIEQQLQAMRGEMVDGLFADSLRTQVQTDGDRAIRALIAGNVASARQGGEQAVQLLLSQTVAVVEEHWARALPELVGAALEGIQPANTSTAENATSSSRDGSETIDIPKTILHSDQHAQDIWRKAHEKAAREGSENGHARRAAYEALKQTYEKKGDRWVKKQEPARSRADADRAGGSDRKSGERDRSPTSASESTDSGSANQGRRSSARSKSGSASGRRRS